MAKYKPSPTGYKARQKEALSRAGFEAWEIQEILSSYGRISRNYALGRQDPAIYLQKAIKARRLYVGNLQRKGFSPAEIHKSILKLYDKKGWMTHPKNLKVPGKRRDPMSMIREYRKKDIESGDYRRPKKKGSHHPLKKHDVERQGQRRRTRGVNTYDAQRANLQRQIAQLNVSINATTNPTQKRQLTQQRDNLLAELRRLE